MGDAKFKLEIPLDDEGFIELECDYCGNRFRMYADDFESEEHLHFFCPVCGLVNDTSSFLCPEVIDHMHSIIENYIQKEISHAFDNAFRNQNQNGFLRFSVTGPEKIPIKELYAPSEDFEKAHCQCCDIDFKIKYLDKEIGVYCPICGGEIYDKE